MTTYILHGGFLTGEAPRNEAMYRRIEELVPDGGTILICLFASTRSEPEDNETFENFQKLISGYAMGKQWRFVNSSLDGFLAEVAEADCIIFRGGSTDLLIERLKAYPGFATSLVGKLVIGSSAGAYMLGALSPSHDKDDGEAAAGTVRTGLGIVPVRVVCHYGSPELPPNAEAVKILENTSTELPIVYLGDRDWQEFTA
jgi:hypothetical protein